MFERLRRHWLIQGLTVILVGALLFFPNQRRDFFSEVTWFFQHQPTSPGSQNPLGYDSVVDTRYLTQGKYYYCHGTCDIPLRSGPSVDAPALSATMHYPKAHAIDGHQYHSLCQKSGGYIQDDRAKGSTV